MNFQKVFLVWISVMWLAACGAGNHTTLESNQVFGQFLKYDPKDVVNSGSPISLTFWTQVDQEPIYQKLINDYTTLHPNVHIELSSASFQDHFTKLQAALNSDIGPDIFHFHNSFNKELLPFMESYPETIISREALEKDFRQVGSHLIDGKIYYIDTGLMTSGIYVNREMWKEAGLTESDYPKTWSQLHQVARKLTKFDLKGNISRAGFNPNGIGFSLFVALNLQQGQTMFAANEKSRPILDTAISTQSLNFIRSLYEENRVTDIHLPEFHESFALGKSAMIYAWGWTNNWLKKNHPELLFDTFPVPTWTDVVPPAYDRNNGESSMGVNRNISEQKKAVAFDLIRFFLAKDDYLLMICQQFSLAPSKRSLGENRTLMQDKFLSSFSKVFDRTIWPGSLPRIYEDLLNKELIDPIIIDKKNVAATLSDVQKKTERRLGSAFFESKETNYSWYNEFLVKN